MSEGKQEGTEFERQDLGAGGILGFFVGLALTGLLLHLILAGMYMYLDNYDKRHQPALNPLVARGNLDMRQPTAPEANQFPLPRLETNERGQLNAVRLDEDQILNSYGWVDEKNGVVHIPIERAMGLLAQRGLPVLPENQAATAESSAQASSLRREEAGKATGNAKRALPTKPARPAGKESH